MQVTFLHAVTHQESATLQEGATLQGATLQGATVQEGATLQGATVQEGATVQSEIIGQEDMTCVNEEAAEVISQGIGYMKFTDNFRNWLKTEKKIKYKATKRYSDCCSNLIRVHGIRENVETYLRNAEENQSKTTYNLKYWTVMYVNEYVKNKQGFIFFNL